MRRRMYSPLIAWCCLGTAAVHAQTVKDPAELMPAKVVAYAELRQPGTVARECAGVFEGSKLTHWVDHLAALQQQGRTPGRRQREEWGVFSLLTAPEVVHEVQRLQGVAVAVTGFDHRKHEPEFLAVVLPGQSNVPGFVMRMFLTMAGPARSIGDVEGVKLYQLMEHRFEAPLPARETYQPYGPALALTPEALFIGSPASVKDAIRRAKGKGQGPTLASISAFQAARKELGDKPGLFLYEDVSAALTLAEPVAVDQMGAEIWKAVQGLVNPKAFQSVAAGWTLEQGTMTYRAIARLNPDEKSPLVDVLPSAPLPTSLLQFAPKNAVLFAGIGNADGEKRLARFLAQADEIVKAQGKGDTLPSYYVEQFETLVLRAKLGKDLMGKVAAVGLVLSDPIADAEKKPFKEPLYAFLVQATSEADAQALLTGMATKWISMVLAMFDQKPTEKTVDGQTLFTLGKEDRGFVHYGRQGAVLAFGSHPAPVAAALNAGAKKQGLLANPAIQAVVLHEEGSIALVVSKSLPTLLVLNMAAMTQAIDRDGDRALRAPAQGPLKEINDLLKLTNRAGPFILTVSRKRDRLVIEARQPGLKPTVGKAVDFLLEKELQKNGAKPTQPASKPNDRQTENPTPEGEHSWLRSPRCGADRRSRSLSYWW